jgi:hypothetical protein
MKSKKKISNTTKLMWTILFVLAVTLVVVTIQFTDTNRKLGEIRSQAVDSKTKPPTGKHFTLSLHAVSKNRVTNRTVDKGNHVYVKENGECKIMLSDADFAITDGNCTDGSAAFSLPTADATNSGTVKYDIWARAVGRPGGSSKGTTCADMTTYESETEYPITTTFCSVYSMELVRAKGQNSFGDVSKYLLYIYADLNNDGNLERYPLFDQALQGYFWDYDNQGVKNAQIRIYPVSATVPNP